MRSTWNRWRSIPFSRRMCTPPPSSFPARVAAGWPPSLLAERPKRLSVRNEREEDQTTDGGELARSLVVDGQDAGVLAGSALKVHPSRLAMSVPRRPYPVESMS